MKKTLMVAVGIVGVIAVASASFMFGAEKPFLEAYEGDHNAVLIDVRTPQEFAEGHIDGAVNIDFYAPDFVAQVERVAQGKDIYAYCRSGSRSAGAKEQLQDLGYTVRHLEGGLLSYTGPLVR